jgi:hypothetical protein
MNVKGEVHLIIVICRNIGLDVGKFGLEHETHARGIRVVKFLGSLEEFVPIRKVHISLNITGRPNNDLNIVKTTMQVCKGRFLPPRCSDRVSCVLSERFDTQ